jgi:hypothetical protein
MKWLPSSATGKWRVIALSCAVLIGAYFAHLQDYYYYFRYQPQEGDIVFQSLPRNDLVDAIEGITHSPYSHCGVVLKDDQNVWVVIEAIGNVHEVPLLSWIKRGRGGDFTVYRLDPKYETAIPAFKEALLARRGELYDYDYNMDRNKNEAYCSSLAYVAFQQVTGESMGTAEKLHDLDWKPYAGFIMAEQNGGLPLDRLMITPAALSRAPQLHEVYRSGL